MKIVFINRYFFPDESATSQILSDLTFHLAHQGWDVRVVSSRQLHREGITRLAGYEVIRAVRVYRVWSSSFGRHRLVGRSIDYLTFLLCVVWTVARLARPGDVIVAKTDPPLLSIPIAVTARLRRAKLVNWMQDIFPEIALRMLSGRLATVVLRLMRCPRNWSLRSAETNVVLGERMAAHLAREGIPAEKIHVIHNWADGEAIVPISPFDNRLRREWQLQGKFLVGYSGNMGRAHEFETLLSAASVLREDPRLAFVFIGDGYRRPWLEAKVRELGLSNIVLRPPQPREALSESLSLADVHVITLRPELEGLIVPSKFYGIAAAGRPSIFIGDTAGEISSIVAEVACGAAVRSGDVQGLVSAIQDLSHEAYRTTLGQNARQALLTRFDQTIAFERWSELFLAVASGRVGEVGDKPLGDRADVIGHRPRRPVG